MIQKRLTIDKLGTGGMVIHYAILAAAVSPADTAGSAGGIAAGSAGRLPYPTSNPLKLRGPGSGKASLSIRWLTPPPLAGIPKMGPFRDLLQPPRLYGRTAIAIYQRSGGSNVRSNSRLGALRTRRASCPARFLGQSAARGRAVAIRRGSARCVLLRI